MWGSNWDHYLELLSGAFSGHLVVEQLKKWHLVVKQHDLVVKQLKKKLLLQDQHDLGDDSTFLKNGCDEHATGDFGAFFRAAGGQSCTLRNLVKREKCGKIVPKIEVLSDDLGPVEWR